MKRFLLEQFGRRSMTFTEFLAVIAFGDLLREGHWAWALAALIGGLLLSVFLERKLEKLDA